MLAAAFASEVRMRASNPDRNTCENVLAKPSVGRALLASGSVGPGRC